MIGGRAAQAVEQLTVAIDALLELPLDPESLPELIALTEVQRRRFEAVDQRQLAGLTFAGRADSLAALVYIDQREARARLKRAGDLGPRQSLTGQPLAPTLPETAAAVERGEVSAAQANVIIGCLERIPPSAPAPAWPVVEKLLVDAAKVEAPRELSRTADAVLSRLDPDGLEPIEDKIERQRDYTLIKHRDGSSTPRGRWSPEATAVWEALLDPLAAPQPTADQPDDRTPGQRRHDAMLEIAKRVLRSGDLPSAGGVPVTVLATTTMRELASAAGVETRSTPAVLDLSAALEGTGVELAELLAADSAAIAVLGHGQTVSARTLLSMACEAQIVPVVFNDAGGIMAYGRTCRLATPGQRLALAARDGGCCFPGCDRPAAWCEVHHVVEWIKDGLTDIDNLCLLCPHHHRSFEKAGWQVYLDDGVPWWVPPPWVDSERRPRRNTVHHRPEIVFRQPVPA